MNWKESLDERVKIVRQSLFRISLETELKDNLMKTGRTLLPEKRGCTVIRLSLSLKIGTKWAFYNKAGCRNGAKSEPFDKDVSAKCHSKNVIILGVISTMEEPSGKKSFILKATKLCPRKLTIDRR